MSINTVVVDGRLTRDLELRHTPSGASVVKGGIAHNRRRKGADGEYVEETHFFDLEAWGNFGELLAKKLSKGSLVTIEGRLQYESWEAQDGSKRSRVSIVVNNVVGEDMFKPASQDNTPAVAQEELVPAGVAADDDIPF